MLFVPVHRVRIPVVPFHFFRNLSGFRFPLQPLFKRHPFNFDVLDPPPNSIAHHLSNGPGRSIHDSPHLSTSASRHSAPPFDCLIPTSVFPTDRASRKPSESTSSKHSFGVRYLKQAHFLELKKQIGRIMA